LRNVVFQYYNLNIKKEGFNFYEQKDKRPQRNRKAERIYLEDIRPDQSVGS